MTRVRKMAGIVVLGVIAAGAVWAYRDYQAWLALGPGGLPYNAGGWMQANWLRLRARDPIDTGIYAAKIGTPGDCASIGDLPPREGPRPHIGRHPVPHRQLDQLPGPDMKQRIAALFDETVSRRRDEVGYQLSHAEKRHPAVTLRQAARAPDAVETHGEVAHVHPSDGSMHMILSASDARTVIDRGWGERHPLAGVLPGLPDTYLLIYPPRTAGELAITARILDGAVAHMAGLPCATVAAPLPPPGPDAPSPEQERH